MGLKINEETNLENVENTNNEVDKFNQPVEVENESKPSFMNKVKDGLYKLTTAGVIVMSAFGSPENKTENPDYSEYTNEFNKTEFRKEASEIQNENNALISKFKNAYTIKDNENSNLNNAEKSVVKLEKIIDNMGNPSNNEDLAVKSLEESVDEANEEFKCQTNEKKYGDEPPKNDK